MKPENRKRLVGIDVLRAIAIITVLAQHWHDSRLWQPPTTWIGFYAWYVGGSVGEYGVILFFAISGFVITRAAVERDGSLAAVRIGAFYSRRIARLGPAFALFLSIGIVTLSTVNPDSRAAKFVFYGTAPYTPAFWVSICSFTFNYMLIHARLSGEHFGLYWSILWTLSVEEQFYLFFPLLARANSLRKRFWAAIASLAAVAVLTRLAIDVFRAHHFWEFATPACVDALAIGVGAAVLPAFQCSREWALRGAAVALVAIGFGFVMGPWAAKPLIIAIGAALVMLCCQNGTVFTSLTWQPLARVGRVSYSVYLFHPLVLYCASQLLQSVSYLDGLVLFIVISTLYAEISFVVIEQPGSRWIRNRWSERAIVPTAALSLPGVKAVGARPGLRTRPLRDRDPE